MSISMLDWLKFKVGDRIIATKNFTELKTLTPWYKKGMVLTVKKVVYEETIFFEEYPAAEFSFEEVKDDFIFVSELNKLGRLLYE